VEFLDSTPMV